MSEKCEKYTTVTPSIANCESALGSREPIDNGSFIAIVKLILDNIIEFAFMSVFGSFRYF